MAYTTATLSCLAGGPVEGGWKLWFYSSTDSFSAMLASGYIADATSKGMDVGDIVIAVNQTSPGGVLLQVQSMTAASGFTSGTATLMQLTASSSTVGSQLAMPRNIIDGGD